MVGSKFERNVEAIRAYRTILIVPSGADPLAGFEHTIREPFFLDQLVDAIKELATPADPASRGSRRRAVTLAPDSNFSAGSPTRSTTRSRPLSAGSASSKARSRSASRRNASSPRPASSSSGSAQIAQALAHLAAPVALGSATFDLRQIAADRANAALAEGARVSFRSGPARSFMIAGNPADYDLLLRLLVAPAHDTGGLEQIEITLFEEQGLVKLAFRDPKGRVPDPDAASDLARLLRAERHQRALGIALGSALARRTGGSFRCEALHPRGASFVLAVPAVARSTEASKGSP